jgi:hypothetical protein
MKRWQYAITTQETNFLWTLWLQEQQGPGAELTRPIRNFESDLAMLSYMSREGWDLVASASLLDGLPRLIFKRRL